MNSLALLSDTIVLCNETDVQYVGESARTTVVQCEVVRTFKGDLQPGAKVSIEFGPIYGRHLVGKGGYMTPDPVTHALKLVPAEHLPKGRTLLFLNKNVQGQEWHVVHAKLIQGGEVLLYGQFQGNPGGLMLSRQQPENVKLEPGQKYDEAKLLEDLQAALKKASLLDRPVPMMPGSRVPLRR